MRLSDADALKDTFIVNTDKKGYLVADPEVLIDNAPTVSERPQGEWICVHEFMFDWQCDKCQCGIKGSKTRFCPHCGARMKGGAE